MSDSQIIMVVRNVATTRRFKSAIEITVIKRIEIHDLHTAWPLPVILMAVSSSSHCVVQYQT
jgi:hypothetical protein